MILSASRRTDIPAFYAPWFFNRIKERYVLVPNPYNSRSISRIGLDPDVVDCIVFWSKNPAPMIHRMAELKEYKYYFQFTINAYGPEMENYLPALENRLDTFRELADKIGKDKVIWRYDPILVNEKYNSGFHREQFHRIASALKGYTEKCMLGFLDSYPHIRSCTKQFGIRPPDIKQTGEMALSFKKSAATAAMQMETCTVKTDLSRLGIPGGSCIDNRLIEKIAGYPLSVRKDKNQRDVCRCVESIDIGMYESCLHGCVYCYAIRGNYNTARNRAGRHDQNSPLLIGQIREGDMVKERELKSLRSDPFLLF